MNRSHALRCKMPCWNPLGNLNFLSTEVKWSESCSAMSNSYYPMDCTLPDSLAHGILQARILEWVAILVSRGSSQTRDRTRVSCIAGRFFTVWATLPSEPPKRFWALAVPNSLLGTLQPMLHFLSPQPGVWRLALLSQASGPKFGLVTTEKR